MNHETLIEIAQATLKRRWRALLLLCAISYPLAIMALRLVEFRYTAQIRMIAVPQTSQGILESQSAALLGSSGSLDRTAMLAGQESLIKSSRVFYAVREIDHQLQKHSAKAGESQYRIGKMAGAIQEVIFGKDYVSTRQKWKDAEFSAFKQRISILVDIESASVTISYKHSDPQIAMLAVKNAAEALQEINVEISKNQAAKKVALLEDKIQSSREENDRISDSITDFARKNRFSSDPRTVEPRYKGYSEANEMMTKARLEIVQRETAVNEIKKVSTRLQTEIKQGLISDREGRLKNLTTELRQYDQAISRMQDNGKSPTSIALKKQIANVRTRISQELGNAGSKMDVSSLQSLLTVNEQTILEQETALRAARRQLEFGEKQLRKFDRELSAIPELSANLSKLTLVQNQQRKVLELLTQRYLEAQIESDSKLAQFYVTEEPTLNDTERLGKLPILISVLLLITVAIATAIVMTDILRGVLITRQQLSRFQLPQYLGAVPFESELRSRRTYAVISEIGVGFRLAHSLRKHLLDPSNSSACKVIAVTSKNARVGKTVTSLGIAVAMQSRGLRTLIVDADYLATARALRNQLSESLLQVTSINSSSPPPAATDSKRHKISLWSLSDEFKTEDDIAHFLMNGFSERLAQLKKAYDCIVVDCAPCFVSSMLLIYEQADINIICFAEGVSTMADVAHATEIVAPSCKENAKIFSALTMTHLKSNAIAPKSSDGPYYKIGRAA